MILQRGSRGVAIHKLPICELIHNTIIASVVKYARGDPRLPETLCNRREIIVKAGLTSSTSQPPRLTPRIFCDPYGKPGEMAEARETRDGVSATGAGVVEFPVDGALDSGEVVGVDEQRGKSVRA